MIIKEVLERLIEKFPEEKDIIDFSDDRNDGKHFSLKIISDSFKEKSRVERSIEIYKTLDDLIKNDSIHALKLTLKTHDEYQR